MHAGMAIWHGMDSVHAALCVLVQKNNNFEINSVSIWLPHLIINFMVMASNKLSSFVECSLTYC